MCPTTPTYEYFEFSPSTRQPPSTILTPPRDVPYLPCQDAATGRLVQGSKRQAAFHLRYISMMMDDDHRTGDEGRGPPHTSGDASCRCNLQIDAPSPINPSIIHP